MLSGTTSVSLLAVSERSFLLPGTLRRDLASSRVPEPEAGPLTTPTCLRKIGALRKSSTILLSLISRFCMARTAKTFGCTLSLVRLLRITSLHWRAFRAMVTASCWRPRLRLRRSPREPHRLLRPKSRRLRLRLVVLLEVVCGKAGSPMSGEPPSLLTRSRVNAKVASGLPTPMDLSLPPWASFMIRPLANGIPKLSIRRRRIGTTTV